MKNFNIVRLDSKGRIIIPYHIRELLDIDEGAEFVILSHASGEIKMLPLIKGKTAEINVVFQDTPGAMARIAEAMAKLKIDFIMSQSKTLERGHLAEMHAIVDVSNCRDLKKVSGYISAIDMIKKVEITER
jgi:AbrB family looped-hinge helix DNA binding protein